MKDWERRENKRENNVIRMNISK